MEIQIKIIGILLMVLAFSHLALPKYMNWKHELKLLNLINRQVMTVHTFFIAFTVFLMGLLCFMSATDLINTELGQNLSLGLAIFWTIRLITQFFVYSSELWKGKTFETVIHILASGFWVYLGSLFWYVYLAY